MVDKPVSKPVAAKAPKAVAAKPVAAKPVVTKPVAVETASAVSKPAAVKAAAKPAAVAAPKPVPAAPAPAAVAEPVTPTPVAPVAAAPVVKPAPEPKIETPAAPAPSAAPIEGKSIMNDTISKAQEAAKTFAEQAAERTQAAFGDMNVRAKDAMAKGTKAIEELVEFSKGNLEAVVASGKVAAKGAEEIARYSADYGRKAIEEANANAKKFAGVKSPTEFFQLQSEVAKSSLDAIVAEGSKFTENYLKLLGEIAQPIQNRVSVAVEKVKTSVAA